MLRVLCLLHQARRTPPALALSHLRQDPVIHQLLSKAGPGASLSRALHQAITASALLQATPPMSDEPHLLLNTEAARRWVTRQGWTPLSPPQNPPSLHPQEQEGQPTIFSLYERYLGVLTPRVAEELKDAEAAYPDAWIRDAFQEAVSRDRRSWPYIARILAQWTRKGRDHDGKPERHPQETEPRAYLGSGPGA